MNFQTRRGLSAVLAAVSIGLLASCGGGSLVDEFDPRRIIAFGDQMTVVDDSASEGNGVKYSINAVEAEDDEPLCARYPNWALYVAESYGLEFPECAPLDAADDTPSINNAQVGARVQEIEAQVDAFFDGPEDFGDRDLVLVMGGANDIIEQYEQVEDGLATESQARTELRRRGEQLAEVVNRIARADGRVVVSTVPHLHRSPYARARPEGDRDVIERLTNEFNSTLRSELLNDGHLIGVMRADLEVARALESPGSRNIDNTSGAACATPLPNCTVETLQDGANVRWMWADDRQFGPTMHRRFGELAVRRARNNPF